MERMKISTNAEMLREAVNNIAVVDAHAHNLVPLDSEFPFIQCFTEAQGEATKDVPHTLSFKRSIREIAKLYNCATTLEAVEKCRSFLGLETMCSKCFSAANISAVLMDDGICIDKMYNIHWHKNHVPIVGRILRIEAVAEEILSGNPPDGMTWTLGGFTNVFLSTLKSLSKDVVGFKSIAACRSGLNINPMVTSEDAADGLHKDIHASVPIRIGSKSFVDYIFTHSLEVAASFDLPMQIHTGFGDMDLDLRLANPLHLRPILEDNRFKNCRIVLLHASYPYSKEASYLASVYPQVFLDFGLAVLKISVHGMCSAVKELLELAPLNKVMFSTDGYAFPETFYLGTKWAREVITSVLLDACDGGYLSIQEAIEAAQKILRGNAINFYKLYDNTTQIMKSKVVNVVVDSHTQYLEAKEGKPKLIRLLWVDTSGQQRCRVVPEKRFYQVVRDHGVGMACVCMAMTSSTDSPAEGSHLTAVGEIRLMPDTSTLSSMSWSDQEKMVLVDMHSTPGQPWDYCPRTTLRRIATKLEEEFGLVVNAGFESEFYLLRREDNNNWIGIDSTPYCSTAAFDCAAPILLEVLKALQTMHISVEQLHAEAGNGQFEIALKYSSCVLAADNLVFLREAIRAVANKNCLRATFVPKYFPMDLGSGCHVHISLWKDGKNKFMAEDESVMRYGISKIGEEFMAGVFHHLPSIMAFTTPLPNSYDRLQPNTWSGAYHCWGRENREAPIRTACPPGISSEVVSNFEIKAFDGCANPYLGLAAIIAAGIDGLQKHLILPEPIASNPGDLKEGTVHRLPKSLDEAVMALKKNEVLKRLLGEKLVGVVIAVREAEIQHYAKYPSSVNNLIHKY
ncbi:protein fluG-like isoform X1 [Cryptomeria japonica]|uniref:protein fluG-like isoform X1 n=1 Tax=Cryptomeria japonica TaxID=3369 RepID=UPI0027DA07A2|nr:protein fluG-like isoform X1 [Cryptomeria japonica]